MESLAGRLAWDQIRMFLAIVSAGSLAKAAERLGLSQPSVSRELRVLEDALGYALFVRHARGVRLTEEGRALLASAERVALAVQGFERAALNTQEVSGTLRVAASEYIGVEALVPELPSLRHQHPRLNVELILDNAPSDLTYGEADVAARLFRPTQPHLIARKIATLGVGLYASRAYLERHAQSPLTLDAVFGPEHELIGFDSRGPMAQAMLRLDPRLTPEAFALRTDSLMAQLAACRAGVGMCAIQHPVARRYPELIHVLPELELKPLELWLVAHEDVRQSPTIRAGLAWLEACLIKYASNT